MQLGYAIEDSPYKGLSFLLQVNNLFDKSTVNYKSVGPNAPAATALYPNYTYTFGRQTLLGMNRWF
ncbi:MAG: hypothetical protein IPP44_14645 [Ideonella sp.]|nr:hypothetical protein [Ideonella sp.]